ncbi:hypothetical protein V502_07796 [Pseudogymnoascus sp. VKM F-4520 (FW-2644)]|nr:hypothetical protein V502_07796 [Pseudogymnoascus sp. VKM F-4520 (FW-2644)]
MPVSKSTRGKAASTASVKSSSDLASKFAALKATASKPSTSKPTANKKRPLPTSPPSDPAKKRPRLTSLNTPPTTKLHIYVCGDGESGELGLGPLPINGKKPTSVKRPRLNPLLSASTAGVVQIAAGGMHCVALTHDQQVLTWGVNDDGALGRDTTWEAPTRDIDGVFDSEDSDDESYLNPKESMPTAIPQESFSAIPGLFVQVVALDSASFALTSTGSVYGWGTFRANDGILGFTTASAKTKNPEKKFQRTPIPIPSLTKIVSLAAGNNHILALDTAGHVFSWGTPEQSQLGRRLPRSRITALTPAPVALPPIAQIACGAYHSFAVAEDGKLYAWGANNFGQTGVPSSRADANAIIPSPTVVEALGGYTIRDIAGGEHHSLACTQEGQVLIWGRCDDSQAGMDLSTLPGDNLVFDARGRPRILAPTLIPGLSFVAAVAAGIDHSFAVTSHGTAYSWGFSENYRTGLGTDETVGTPTLVGEGKIIIAAECGGQFSVLAGPAGLEGDTHIMDYGHGVMAGQAGMEKYKLLASRAGMSGPAGT